jgi:nitroreductase
MSIKTANTENQVLDLIKNRWSPRSFSNKAIPASTLNTILEAGSWAPSANNSQPWRFIFGINGTPGFDKILSSLAPGNQVWAKNVAVLVATIGIKEVTETQRKNHYFQHDIGLATSFMLLQAQSEGVYGHVMAGFNKQQMTELAAIPATEEPVTVIAFGYVDDAEKLDEPYKTGEVTPRTRNPLSTVAVQLD